jgi:RsiW-degrading membrane proteinase PrsW (M82 family)
MVIRVFFWGMAIGIPTVLIERGISGFLGILVNIDAEKKMTVDFLVSHLFIFLLYNFLGIAFIEELLKYLVVREKVLRSPAFDEPVDAMLYMIIAALGFAALENLFFLLGANGLVATAVISLLRFLGATFLHALCAGVIGYFLILSIYETKKRSRFIFLGIILATVLHGCYNISIIKITEDSRFILLPIIILVYLAFFVLWGLRRVKKLSSTCKVK